jgi:ribosome-associated protein
MKRSDLFERLKNESEFRFVRSSGPGGQNVNKTATKCSLSWSLARSSFLRPDQQHRFRERFGSRIARSEELVIASDRFRDRLMNQKDAVMKLVRMVESILEPPRSRKKTKPTRSSKKRRLDQKKQRGQIKQGRSKVQY